MANKQFESILAWRSAEDLPCTMKGEQAKPMRPDPRFAQIGLWLSLDSIEGIGKSPQCAIFAKYENPYSVLVRRPCRFGQHGSDRIHDRWPLAVLGHGVIHKKDPEDSIALSKLNGIEALVAGNRDDPNMGPYRRSKARAARVRILRACPKSPSYCLFGLDCKRFARVMNHDDMEQRCHVAYPCTGWSADSSHWKLRNADPVEKLARGHGKRCLRRIASVIQY
jgi:hypothetical protein